MCRLYRLFLKTSIFIDLVNFPLSSGTPPYHVVYDPVHRDIEHRLELYGIHPLIRECHVFLGVLGELDDHLRSLHEIGAEYWDARVEGVLKVYLFNVSIVRV